MVALFAAGVITGTVLSFEMGVLWPNFMATFGAVFGLGLAIEVGAVPAVDPDSTCQQSV
jgi:cytochrome d ubiquinol oxidase subunit I